MDKQRATAQSWPTKPMPVKQRELTLDGRYLQPEMDQITLGFIPRDSQDKWFLYFDDAWLHCHRSQTGTCVFQLQLLADEHEFRAVRFVVNQDPSQYKMTDDTYNVSLLSYLVDHLLLGRFAQMPLPGKMSEQDQQRHRRHVMGEKERVNPTLQLRVQNGRPR